MMLKSLFGDLQTDTGLGARLDASRALVLAPKAWQAVRHDPGEINAVQRLRDADVQWVRGSPAQAMRAHLATVERRDDVRMIALLDRNQRCAPGLVLAVADATGQPLERLSLIDQASQQVLAVLERTVVPRRADTTLKLYHVSVPTVAGPRAADDDREQTPLALMEVSDMVVVFVQGGEDAALDDTLAQLSLAVHSLAWRCPTLLFLAATKSTEDHDALVANIHRVDWPDDVGVSVLPLPPGSDHGLGSMAAIWRTLLDSWDHHDMALTAPADVAESEAIESARAMGQALRQLMGTPGLAACAVADAHTGNLLVGESHTSNDDLALVAAALAPLVVAQQSAALALHPDTPMEEAVLTAGAHVFVVRPLRRAPARFLFARLHRAMSNLTLVRLKVAEAQRQLD